MEAVYGVPGSRGSGVLNAAGPLRVDCPTGIEVPSFLALLHPKMSGLTRPGGPELHEPGGSDPESRCVHFTPAIIWRVTSHIYHRRFA